MSLLQRLTAGNLTLILPDGTTKHFGDCKSQTAATVTVTDDQFFVRCLLYADLGLAESYLDGLCDISSIKNLISIFLLNQKRSPFLNESPVVSRLINVLGAANKIRHATRANSKSNSRTNIEEHYDLGNSFFSLFLDQSMTYSSALFKDQSISLEEAQKAKYERIAAQLQIHGEDRVLEVGCGWGAFSCYVAKTFGCRVTALTISPQQFAYTQNRIHAEHLEHLIELRLEDYRDHKGAYDKIASIEMIEAVGDQYINQFIAKLDELLAEDGLLVMQMITCADSRYRLLKSNVDFIQKHIFPGSLLQSLNRVSEAMLACGELMPVDLFDMTASYVTTLSRWQENFEHKGEEIRALGFDERFIRKWRYYFEYCQAAFSMRNVSVVQATYSRPNNLNLAEGVRAP